MTVDPYNNTGTTDSVYGEDNLEERITVSAALIEEVYGFTPIIGGSTSDLGYGMWPVGVPVDWKVPAGYAAKPVVDEAGGLVPGEFTQVKQFDRPVYTQNDLSGLYGASPDQVAAWQQRLYNMGFLQGGDFMVGIFDPDTHDALENAMTVANANGYTFKEMERILKQGQKTAQEMGWTSSSGGSSGSSGASYDPYTVTTNSSTVSTSENVNLTGRGGARALLVNALANEIGREPTRKEVSRFLAALNRAERRNPATSKTKTDSTTTTTTDPSPSGDATVDSNTKSDSTTTTRQSDLDPNQKAIQWARQHGGKEAQRYQAANFFSVIEAMVGL